MITDRPPRKLELKDEYNRSDAMRTIALPDETRLRAYAKRIEETLKSEDRKKIEIASNDFASFVADHFEVSPPPVKILGVRPLEENGDIIHETFGDYTFKTTRIRLWMRTAVLEKTTAYGTFLSTLCHEICHHLDVVCFDLPDTYHTCGFYERAGLLYHHARGTPLRPLVWDKQTDGRFRINWPQTMRGAKAASAK